jgi:hypothetical protein
MKPLNVIIHVFATVWVMFPDGCYAFEFRQIGVVIKLEISRPRGGVGPDTDGGWHDTDGRLTAGGGGDSVLGYDCWKTSGDARADERRGR